MNDRRTALKILASGVIAFPILADDGSKYTAKVFDTRQLELLAELTDRIIPRTDTPGAADAGVPLLIDRLTNQSPEAAAQWKELLAWFSAQGDTSAARLAVLETISTESGTLGARYFKMLKETTIDQYYATKAGLEQELGWHGSTYLPEFIGCTHPEHQINESKG
ncbi:MAG TPA: gluconate 2-dehydrogenase subunit 3 family protein [Bryobacteraceae bacterium]|jgi:hypothetical protein